MKKSRVILLVLIVLAAVAAFLWASDWLKIDKCLDGGGRWDDANKRCQFATGVKI